MSISRRVLATLFALVVSVPLAAGCAQRVSRPTDDTTIQVRVRAALLNAPDVKGSAIDVNVTNGVVTLSGPVGSEKEALEAIKLARSVSGVTEVRSQLEVK